MRVERRNFDDRMRAAYSSIEFYANAHRDAAAKFLEYLTDKTLNFEMVGVVSGNLRRSFDLQPLDVFSTVVVHDQSIAPYGIHVLNWTEQNFSKNFIDETIDTYWPEIYRDLKAEHDRMWDIIGKRKVYKYQNPFE